MIFKRDESFRYEFKEPLPLTFSIHEIDNQKSSSSPGIAKLIDISPSGCKIFTPLEIPSNSHEINLTLNFTLSSKEFVINGAVLWSKAFGKGFYYGLKTTMTDEETGELLSELKSYVKNE